MNAKILKFLTLTPDQYKTKVLDLWVNWCVTKSQNPKSLQKLLICQPLFNWWLRELRTLEDEFVEDIEGYKLKTSSEACIKAYNYTTSKIYRRFSKPLIQYANDSKSINKQD